MNRPSNLIDCAEAIRATKEEIHDLVDTEIVPDSVRSFSELHDYIDANELGGFCDEAGIDWSLEHRNIVQDSVHAWLSNGGHLV